MFTINFNQPIHIHFIGIGGISMSGLAEILIGQHFMVSGSDNLQSDLTDKLQELGATIGIIQRPENIPSNTEVVVYTAAVKEDNIELMAAKKRQLPLLTRAQLLGQLMDHYKNSIGIAGTHGKTTTTSMIAQILLDANTDPTITIGGILSSINDNTKVGHSDIFVAEACEYTNSFYNFYPMINVVLNIEEDHLDFFKDLADIRQSFKHYISNTQSGGTLIINHQIDQLEALTQNLTVNLITFGFDNNATYQAANIHQEDIFNCFDVYYKGTYLDSIKMTSPGIFNISNALAALAVARELKVPMEDIKNTFMHFVGAKRRFQYKGTFQGATVIDDYAHHPTEISATLTAARNLAKGRILCIFQPHTYTRTHSLFNDFVKALSLADEVILADIYAAREINTIGITSDDLRLALEKAGTKACYYNSFDKIIKYLSTTSKTGDLLITMGAGDVVNIGNQLVSK